MPQPNKKRGRRMEGKKRKLEDGVEDLEVADTSSKRRKSSADGVHDQRPISTATQNEDMDLAHPAVERPFFGMLDDDEQEYFKRADDLLESNAFGDDEERNLFHANVYREADGKELKIAQSQSCSRLMERLIQLSSPGQLKKLFRSFSSKYVIVIPNTTVSSPSC